MSDIKISQVEYNALRKLFAITSMLQSDVIPFLKDRCKLFPTGWMRMRGAETALANLVSQLMNTLPDNKMDLILYELGNTFLDVRTSYNRDAVPPDNYALVSESALVELIKRAQGVECDMCAKTGRKVAACPLRKAIDGCVLYDIVSIPKSENGHCKYSQFKIGEEE